VFIACFAFSKARRVPTVEAILIVAPFVSPGAGLFVFK
jgi:hypothetical protein